MISISNSRFKDGQNFDLGERIVTVEKAFESLILFELGYGGKMSFISPTKLICLTTILDCKDTTIFEGSEDDMKILIEVSEMHYNPNPPLSSIMGMYTNMSIGVHTVRDVLLGMVKPTGLVQLNQLKAMTVVDLIACVLLVRRDNFSLEEVLT